MTAKRKSTDSHLRPDRLLTVAQVAELLAPSERFPRLIAEHRIRFVCLGENGKRGHVRIPESAPERGKVRLSEYPEAWIEQRPGLRPRTTDLYTWLFNRHIAPYLGDTSAT